MKAVKRRRTPKAAAKRYGRIVVGGTIILVIVLLAVFAPYITSYDPAKQDLTNKCARPDAEHIFGTDVYGRDLFARIIYGGRVTLIVSFGVQFCAVVLGAVCGLVCGYFKSLDTLIMRLMEGLNSIPGILLALIMTQVFGPSMFNLMVALTIGLIPGITRMTRSQVLSLREKEFIESEKAMGASNFRIIFGHIMPSCSHYFIIRFITGFAGNILATASLSYLGVGLDPSIPNWGAIVASGQGLMLIHPHLVIYPGVAITITAFAFSMFGEGMREILDPKLR